VNAPKFAIAILLQDLEKKPTLAVGRALASPVKKGSFCTALEHPCSI
jgi:hypothetical protein